MLPPILILPRSTLVPLEPLSLAVPGLEEAGLALRVQHLDDPLLVLIIELTFPFDHFVDLVFVPDRGGHAVRVRCELGALLFQGGIRVLDLGLGLEGRARLSFLALFCVVFYLYLDAFRLVLTAFRML
jgi:hypothetical protein